MKILVTGANGMLAKEVKEKFAKENEVIATDVSELDITNEKKSYGICRKYKARIYNKLCSIYSCRQSRRKL
ncbi:MAG: sugar nucleotide-binding protein [Clostridia bacterium]